MSNKYEIRHSCLLFSVAASMVLRHRYTAKNRTINNKRITIRAAMPNNDKRGDFWICHLTNKFYFVEIDKLSLNSCFGFYLGTLNIKIIPIMLNEIFGNQAAKTGSTKPATP